MRQQRAIIRCIKLTSGVIKTAIRQFLGIPPRELVSLLTTHRKVCYTYKFLTAATTACVNGDDEALDILAAVPNLLLKVVEYISPKSCGASKLRHNCLRINRGAKPPAAHSSSRPVAVCTVC